VLDPLAICVDKMFNLVQVDKFTREIKSSRRLVTFMLRVSDNQLQRMRQQIKYRLQ
jgi:hypothetical protein